MQRKTLFDNADYACPIVGTCLTVAELRRLCRKCGDAPDADVSDYEAHTFLVAQAKVAGGGPAKHLQRFLDKKYRRDLRTFRRVRDPAELRRLWRERADAGDVPGPFWALLSHPDAPEDLRREIFGEVHMLSHRVGAANRADLSRLARLEENLSEARAALDEGKSVLRRAVAVWKGRCREAMEALGAERAKRQAIERERISLRAAIENSAVAAVSRDRDRFQAQLAQTRARLQDTEAEVGRQALSLERLHADLERTRLALADRDREVEALEASLFAALGTVATAAPEAEDDCPCRENGASCPCPAARACGLAGKRILYVGGRCSLVAHYKLLAAKFGCELLHHDGGREQSAHRLWELLGAADAVVCPVDCVSHEACALVKQACKGCLKPLVLVRSSGLSSLARSLTELESGQAQ